MPDLEKISQKIIEFSFYALFFLVPLILTPWNFELFEFNKMLLVYALTAIIGCAWLVKMVASKKIFFQRTFWDIPLILFLTSQLISFVFSIDHHTSLWGYYSRLNGGLLSTICYLLLYWAFVSNFHPRRGVAPAAHLGGVFICLLSSATLVASYGIAEHFGIDAKYWVQDVRNRVFSTLGQPNWLAAWLVALMPLTWAFGLNAKFKMPFHPSSGRGQNSKLSPQLRDPASAGQRKIQNFLNSEFTFYILHFTFYICLLYTHSRSGLLGFAVAYLIFWPLVFWLRRYEWKIILRPFLVFSFLLLVISFLAGSWIPSVEKITRLFSSQTPTNQQSINNQSTINQPLLISESGDIRKVVWKGAIEIWRHHPIFGTGPETFAYSYYWYRPREHNDLSEWDFLYNKAHNEYLNFAANTGTVGLGGYLLLIGWYLVSGIRYQVLGIKYSKTKTRSSPDTSYFILNTSLLTGFTSILVTNFFGFSIVPVNLLFFLFPAMSAVLMTKDTSEVFRRDSSDSGGIGTILTLLVTCYVLLVTGRYWLADIHFARGEKLNKAGQYDLAFNSLQQAVKLRSVEPVYHDELAIAAANLAVLAENQKNASLSAQLAELAIASSNKAVGISPYHLNFWKNRTKIYYKLAEIKPEYYQQALTSLLRATGLAPTDPKVRYNLGLIYAAVDQTDTAIRTLEETIQLKPNYEDPRYALALFYEQKGERQKAREQLEYILDKINPASQKAKEKLKEL